MGRQVIHENIDDPTATVERIRNKYRLFNPARGMREETARLQAAFDRHERRMEAAMIYCPGTHNYDDLFALCLGGRLTLWDLPESFMITEMIDYPRARHFHIFLAGGDLKELVDMHDDVISMARALGCSRLSLAGRPGWERALKAHGWNPYLVTVAKEI